MPAGLIVALVLAPAAMALEAPQAGRTVEDAKQALSPVQPILQEGVKAANQAVAAVPDPTSPDDGSSTSPSGSEGGQGAGGPGLPTPPPTPPVVGRVLDKIHETVPGDVVGTARQVAREASDQVTQVLPLPGSGQQQTEGHVETQAAATDPPRNTMLLAGGLIVAGATAAAATYVVLWLAGSSGSLSAAAATSELRRVMPFASPLFTRFERGTVLGHPRREQLYARILQEPGISLQDLGKATGLSRTAVVHHLRLLEQQHLVISRRVGRSRHYYENGGRYGHDQKEAYAIMRNERSRAVADYIKLHPGTMQKSLCEALHIPPSIAHWHVRRLEEGGLVQTIRQGRAVAYYPGANLTSVSAGVQVTEPAAAPAPAPSPAVATSAMSA